MKICKLLIGILLISLPLVTSAQCKVLLKNIDGVYTGDCKKGKAQGMGESVGEDTYKGMFKKGYPNGEGVYTWANGNVFRGFFKNGKKDGAGELTVKETGETLKGYWSKDNYIGLEKNPYKILQKAPSISSASFKHMSGRNELIVTFLKNGRATNIPLNLISIEGSFGNMVSNRLSTTVQSVVFPFVGRINYEGEEFRFKITQEGTWTIKLNVR